MRGAVDHPLARKVMAYQQAMATGDVAAARTVFQPDVVYVVPGANVMSGRYEGPDAVMGYLGRLMALTQGSYAIPVMTWLACGDDLLLETRNTAQIGDRSLTWDEAILFRFKDGLKAEIVLFQADQAAVDGFFGS